MKTIEEMMEQLKQIDEVTLLELMHISSEDLVERFKDLIENEPERYAYELAQWYDDSDEEVEDIS